MAGTPAASIGATIHPAADSWTWMRAGSLVKVPLLVFVAYAAGAELGMVLRLPGTIPSVVWPPNAILTTALLFTPPRRWWVILAAAFPAHLLIELEMWPLPLVVGLFVTNCSESMIAGFMLHRFSDAPSRFDTLRRVTLFLVWGALFAPFVSSFLDAGVASVLGGQDYWSVWSTRFPSNVLGTIAIVPALSGVLHTSLSDPLKWPPRRWFQATGIAAGIVLAALVLATDVGYAGFEPMALALFFPWLLWASVTFGAAGAGLSILATVLVVVEAAVYGRGILEHIPAEERVRALQLGLSVVSAALMCLAALVEERRQAENALQLSDVLKSAILGSLPSLVAVLDRGGRIIAVNDSWTRFAHENHATSGHSAGVGASYLGVCAAAAYSGEPGGTAALDGIRKVLNNAQAAFSMEYTSHGPQHESRWVMRVVPLRHSAGGAVVTHTDVTDRHRAELDARHSREELAHLSRVFVLGELTASLSHQLNQPLTGIMGNAQAGRRFLDAQPPNMGELRQIFTDIISDAKRAADFIRGLREMMKKGSTEYLPLNVNDIVENTSRIVDSDALIRNVSLKVEVAPSLPLVRGDAVQLQQVVLNLLLNAMEAVSTRPALEARVVDVRTEVDEPDSVRVSVSDTGPGLPTAADDLIFEPFYTTKPSGTGLGLSIARSIVESHGGTLRARNRPGGGAVFQMTLPSVSSWTDAGHSRLLT
jgi:signal transduction histidine kinase